jgi:splicing factor 3B subunit 4
LEEPKSLKTVPTRNKFDLRLNIISVFSRKYVIKFFMSFLQENRNQENTIYVGNIDERVSEPLLWELFLQAAPVINVHLPKDRVTQTHQGTFLNNLGFGFVEFISSIL